MEWMILLMVGNHIVLNLPSSLSISLWVRNPQGTILSNGLSLKPLVLSRTVMDLINILISTGKNQTVGNQTLSLNYLLDIYSMAQHSCS